MRIWCYLLSATQLGTSGYPFYAVAITAIVEEIYIYLYLLRPEKRPEAIHKVLTSLVDS